MWDLPATAGPGAPTERIMLDMIRSASFWKCVFRPTARYIAWCPSVLFVALLGMALASSAAAQTGGDSALVRALSGFRAGQPIQVALLRNRWTGEFRSVRGDTLFIGSRDQLAMALRFNALDTLWRRSSRRPRGAWIGGTSGAILVGFASMITMAQGGAEG